MSNKQRYRSGAMNVCTGKIQGGQTTVAEIGDNVALVGNYVLPLSHYTDSQTSTGEAAYLGVLIEGATVGNETADVDCVVARSGEFEFDCDALGADQPPGTPFGPASDGAGKLADQKVAPTTKAEAIAKVSRYALRGDTTVVVAIRSLVMESAY